jgi:SET domain-containing protein
MDKRKAVPKQFLQVKKSSAGLGLFTLVDLPKGQFVIEYVGNILTEEQAQKRGGKYLFEISNRRTIDGTPRWNTARYINHSCKPNCEPWNMYGRIKIKTIKAIKAGEELTYNYGSHYFNDMLKGNCLCAPCASKRGTK